VRKYVLTVLFVQLSLSSTYVGDDVAMIPKPNHETLAWQGLTDLRISLVERGMLNEALSLFKVERSRLPPTERADATLWFLERSKKHKFLTKERSIWVEIELRVYLAQSLYERRGARSGETEFQTAEELLECWCKLSDYTKKETLTPFLDIKILRLRYRGNDDLKVHFNESVQLLEVLKACCHTSTVACYHQATEAAYELAPEDTSGYYQAQFIRLHQEQEAYQEMVLEDIRSLLFDHQDFFQYAARNVTDIRKTLEWHDNFLERYAGFNLPDGLMGIHRNRKIAYQQLGDPERMAQEDAEVKKLENATPERFGRLVGVRRAEAGSTVPSQPNGDSEAEMRFALDIEEDNFFTEWYHTIGDTEPRRYLAFKKLLEWMIMDLKTGVIAGHEVLSILAIQGGDKDYTSLAQKLEAIPPDEAFAMLYLQSMGKEDIPISPDAWKARSEVLENWLSRDSGLMNNSRQYLRAVLQEIRKNSVCASEMPLDIKISELERCMSMVKELPPRVKENIAQQSASWHGSIADHIHLHCCRSPDQFGSDGIGSYIARAETECQWSITGYQAKGEAVCTAMRQRLAAELCVMKIYWLHQRQGKAMNETDVETIRERGLQNLELAESFFASKRQEITWGRDLDALEQRQRATNAENSWRIAQIAMQLLNAGKVEANESRKLEMWKWVQRSKARSLATSMGLEGTIPEFLLNDVLASDKCRSMYEQMVSLQSQIQLAQPHRRFALRHELDLHLAEMKKDKLLKEVCDLKDGMPLTLSALDSITEVARTALVLVDWYVVPDLFGDGTLLLFTAKAGRAPTVTTLDIATIAPIDWVTHYLDGSMSQQRSKDMSDLNALVQPLIDLSDQGDILVFCPSAALHRIPLHAIEVANNNSSSQQPIIFRNPVFYSHSHSLLRICLWNAQLASEAKVPLETLVMNGIPKQTEIEKYSAGRDSAMQLAERFSTTASLDESSTKSKFTTEAPTSRLIHIHSHVWWDASDPLAHHIDLNHEKLTAREIFPVSFLKGTHVSLIACSGGRARVGNGDEVMGLVPALLHSGASSTVSTLWSIPDTIGAKFTDAFYKEFCEQRNGLLGGGGFINLAKVFQSAVKELALCEMRESDAADLEPMLHWTSFVVHGFWDFFVPQTTTGP